MPAAAQLTVTSGPDRGRVFDLGEEELVHIGTGPENHVVLSDPAIAEHQASIVSRNGRYAIFTPQSGSVDVDGDRIPADQWVWLPDVARIRIGQRTAVQFTGPTSDGTDPTNGKGPAAASAAAKPAPAKPAPPPPSKTTAPNKPSGPVDPFADDDGDDAPGDAGAESPSKAANRKGKRRRPRSEKPREPKGEKRQVAQFVTDQTGETVVTLGEDGQLPELQLREGAARAKERRKAEAPKPEGTSPVLYVVLLVSMLSSIAMLFLDFTPGQSSQRERMIARQQLRDYIGSDETAPEPYQAHIRRAILAYERGDGEAEKEAYYEVLDLLNAEDNDKILGLTGNPDRDKRLRELISTVLSR
jgi:hypothetical protein